MGIKLSNFGLKSKKEDVEKSSDEKELERAIATDEDVIMDEDNIKAKQFEKETKKNIFTDWLDFGKKYKSDLIKCAIFTGGFLLIWMISSIVKDAFATEYMNQTNNYIALQTDIEHFKQSKEYMAYNSAVNGVTLDNMQTGVEVNWIGDKIDTGRWMTDDEYFWKWIEPAFEFESATEYNAMRNEFYSEKGLGSCLFTTQFLAPYSPELDLSFDTNKDGQLSPKEAEAADQAFTCSSSKAKYRTYPIGTASDGSYEYLALVPMKRNNTSNYIMVAFTFTMHHKDTASGVEEITISDFNCWPPDAKKLYYAN